MVDGNLFMPLSPPSSPRMSAYSTTPAENDWPSADLKTLDPSSGQSESDMALLQADLNGHNFDLKRPPLRTAKSFPYILDNKLHHSNGTDSPSRERVALSTIDDLESHEMATVTYGGSAPASPVSRLTPPSPHEHLDGAKDESHDDDIVLEDNQDCSEEPPKEEQKPAMTAAEIRAQKRKMKRFRYERPKHAVMVC